MRNLLALVLVLALGAGVVACGSDSDSGNEKSSGEAATKADGTWELMNIGSTTEGWATSIPNNVAAPTLEIADGTVDIETGCSAGSGDLKVNGDKIDFGSVNLEKQDCDLTQKQIQQLISKVFTGSAAFSINADGNLVLDGGGYTLVYTQPDSTGSDPAES